VASVGPWKPAGRRHGEHVQACFPDIRTGFLHRVGRPKMQPIERARRDVEPLDKERSAHFGQSASGAERRRAADPFPPLPKNGLRFRLESRSRPADARKFG